MEHSEISPSKFSDVIACPGRVKLSRGLEPETSFAAAEGTVAHSLAEISLKNNVSSPGILDYSARSLEYPNGFKKDETITFDDFKIKIDTEMIEGVKMYFNHINSLREKYIGINTKEDIESTVNLGDMSPRLITGTIDYSLEVYNDTLYIRDFKYGKGIIVDAKKNDQLMGYALMHFNPSVARMFMKDEYHKKFWPYKKINLGIVQPRSRDGVPIKEWEIDIGYLKTWYERKLKPAILDAYSISPSLTPGSKQCRWCLAKKDCPAIYDEVKAVFKIAIVKSDEFVHDVKDISIPMIENIYPKLTFLKEWIIKVEKKVYNHLLSGHDFNGLKLVKGPSRRSWNKEPNEMKTILEKLGVCPFENKIVSPAQAEKKLTKEKKTLLNYHVSYSEPNLISVNCTDRRKKVVIVENVFKKYVNRNQMKIEDNSKGV